MVVGSRGSRLALLQADWVVRALQRQFPGLQYTIRTIKTQGDRQADVPLSQFGSTGVFVKEIERSLLAGTIDLAVHSLKDVPPDEAPGTVLGAFPERADPRDVLVSPSGRRLSELRPGDRVGTSSTRRLAQLRAARPDLRYLDLRGNVETRINQAVEGHYEAIVLAAAGLIRLGRDADITEYLPPEVCLPDAGQGILGVQTRQDDPEVTQMVASIDDPEVRAVALAERAVIRAFGGGCSVPVAAYGRIRGADLELEALVAAPDGSHLVKKRRIGPANRPEELGREVWSALQSAGADEIIGSFRA